jgi:hypothetical protein
MPAHAAAIRSARHPLLPGRPFYERRGYEVFGTLDDYPKGHKKFFLKKKL